MKSTRMAMATAPFLSINFYNFSGQTVPRVPGLLITKERTKKL